MAALPYKPIWLNWTYLTKNPKQQTNEVNLSEDTKKHGLARQTFIGSSQAEVVWQTSTSEEEEEHLHREQQQLPETQHIHVAKTN